MSSRQIEPKGAGSRPAMSGRDTAGSRSGDRPGKSGKAAGSRSAGTTGPTGGDNRILGGRPGDRGEHRTPGGEKRLKRTLNIGYGGIHATYWMFYGVSNSFASAFLLPRGYSNAEIGIILAAASVIAVFLQPIMADFVDRSRKISLIGITQICTVLMMVLEAFLFVTNHKSLGLYVVFIMVVAWMTALQPLFNSLSFKLEESGVHINFGMCRSMGSLGYAVLCAFLGTLVEKLGSGVLPVTGEMTLAALLITLIIVKRTFDGAVTRRAAGDAAARDLAGSARELAAMTGEAVGGLDDLASDAAAGGLNDLVGDDSMTASTVPTDLCDSPEDEINLWRFVRENKLFLLMNLGVIGIYFSNSVLNSFMLQVVNDVGGTSEDMGRVLSLMAFLEIPALFFFDKIKARFSCSNILKVAAVCFGLKVGLIYLAKSMWLIYVAHIFQTFGFGLFLPAMVVFIDETMRKGEAVKGQAFFTAMTTVSSMIASVLGGLLLDTSGAKFMLLVSTLITAAGAAVIIAAVNKIEAKR